MFVITSFTIGLEYVVAFSPYRTVWNKTQTYTLTVLPIGHRWQREESSKVFLSGRSARSWS